MDIIPLNLAFEDQLSEFVMIKMAESTSKFHVSYSYTEGGFGYLKKNINGWNDASKGCPFFVLTDLDLKDCAPTLIEEWLAKEPHPNLIFRVAVKQVEAWLLADIEGFSKYTGISIANFNDNIEGVIDSKAELLRLVRRCRKREIREDILPLDDYAKIGPNYNGRLSEFVNKHWNIKRAMERSDSLKRAMSQLSSFEWVIN